MKVKVSRQSWQRAESFSTFCSAVTNSVPLLSPAGCAEMILHTLTHLLLLVCVCSTRPGESSRRKKNWPEKSFRPSPASPSLLTPSDAKISAHMLTWRWMLGPLLHGWVPGNTFLFPNYGCLTCCVICDAFMLLLKNSNDWGCKDVKAWNPCLDN